MYKATIVVVAINYIATCTNFEYLFFFTFWKESSDLIHFLPYGIAYIHISFRFNVKHEVSIIDMTISYNYH